MVPTLDVSLWIEGDVQSKKAFATSWDAAFRTWGFAIIVNHSVPITAINTLRSKARDFFHLDMATKLQSKVHDGYGGGGYAPPGAEAVARSSEQPNAPPDAVESLVFSNGSAPPNTKLPPDFQLAVSDYSDAMKGLLSVLMQVSEASLGLETGFFETFYKGAPNFLRLAYYAPDRARTAEGEGGGGAEAAGGAAAGEAGGEAGGAAGAANVAAPAAGHSEQQRYGAHTDYQGFTILSQDAAGLQVRMTDDDGGSARWVGVEPVQGALIINAGDLLQHWTNGVWISNVHRVVKAPGAFERLSLVCFTGPRDDATIVPLPQCVAEKGGKATYAPILAGEHLKAKLAKTSLL